MTRRLTTIALAVLLGLIGTLAVLYYVRGADQRAVQGKSAVNILVAAKAIPGGTAVSALVSGGYVTSEPFPQSSVPGDAVKSLGDLPADDVVRDNVLPGQIVRSSLVVPKGSSATFAIPQGKIAVTIQLNDPERVAGYVTTGSKVVVFASGVSVSGNAKGTRTLLTDLEVLSVSTPSSSGGINRGTGDGLVTLAVSQDEAEKLIYADTGGSALYLGLEGDGSNLNPQSPGVTAVSLFN